MEQFASGWKRNYYGKGDVIVYRLNREGPTPAGQSPVFGAKVLMLLYGDAFWPTYTTGRQHRAHRDRLDEELHPARDDELSGVGPRGLLPLSRDEVPREVSAGRRLVSAEEIPYTGIGGPAFTPSGPDRATARVELQPGRVVEARSGIRGFKLLRLGGSAFHGFVRDEYTTLPDLMNRPLHMWLDLEWHYTDPAAAFNGGQMVARVREIVREVFETFESGSIQQLIHLIGTRCSRTTRRSLRSSRSEQPTWDTIAERGSEFGVYTDARPPYGCLGSEPQTITMARLSTHVLDTSRGRPRRASASNCTSS